jgi:hypothetical protein
MSWLCNHAQFPERLEGDERRFGCEHVRQLSLRLNEAFNALNFRFSSIWSGLVLKILVDIQPVMLR